MIFGLFADYHFVALYFFGALLAALLIRRMRLKMIGNIGKAVRRKRGA